jgi:hypothetical protein
MSLHLLGADEPKKEEPKQGFWGSFGKGLSAFAQAIKPAQAAPMPTSMVQSQPEWSTGAKVAAIGGGVLGVGIIIVLLKKALA